MTKMLLSTSSVVNPFAPVKKDEGADEYRPTKSHYHPVDDACWKHKEK